MILSAVMLLKYLHEEEEALKLEKALIEVLNEGKKITPDLGGNFKTEDMTQEIIRKLKSMK